MREFHYFPPSEGDQCAFIMQILGTILALILVAFLWWRLGSLEMHATLIGASVAVLWRLGSAAWQLERKARRSQLAKVGFDEDQLQVVDWHGVESDIPWKDITSCEVKGGKLLVQWEEGQLHVGARELEDGMEFVQHVAKKVHGDKSPLITLTPREPSHEPAHPLSQPPPLKKDQDD